MKFLPWNKSMHQMPKQNEIFNREDSRRKFWMIFHWIPEGDLRTGLMRSFFLFYSRTKSWSIFKTFYQNWSKLNLIIISSLYDKQSSHEYLTVDISAISSVEQHWARCPTRGPIIFFSNHRTRHFLHRLTKTREKGV